MNYKTFVFALLVGAIFLYGCSSKESKNKTTSNLEFGTENTQFRNTETKNQSPYAMFGDSSFVLMTEQERNGKHSLDIENGNVAKIELDLYLGRVRTFDVKGNLVKEIFLDTDNFARFLSIDRLAHKYPDLNPYNFVGNNPIRNIDPNGDSIVVVNAGQGKPAKNKSRFEALVSNSFNGKINASLTTTGALKMSFAEGQSLETLTRKELAFYNVLNQASNGKNINGENVDVNIKVVFSPTHPKYIVMVGQAETKKIDIDDIEMFPINGEMKLTQRALLAHEIKEQYEMQVNDKVFTDAHNDALMSEILITDFQREEQTRRPWIKANKQVGFIYPSNNNRIKIYTDKNLNVKKVEQ